MDKEPKAKETEQPSGKRPLSATDQAEVDFAAIMARLDHTMFSNAFRHPPPGYSYYRNPTPADFNMATSQVHAIDVTNLTKIYIVIPQAPQAEPLPMPQSYQVTMSSRTLSGQIIPGPAGDGQQPIRRETVVSFHTEAVQTVQKIQKKEK